MKGMLFQVKGPAFLKSKEQLLSTGDDFSGTHLVMSEGVLVIKTGGWMCYWHMMSRSQVCC